MLKKIILSTLFLTVAPVHAASVVTADANMVKQSIPALMQKDHIPGMAIVLYVDGKPSTYYFGYANQEKKTPVTSKTIFEIGSISKVYTSLLLAEEVDAAKVQLEDAVTDFLPSISENLADVTLVNLATHTAGFPFMPPSTVKTAAEFNQYLANYSADTMADQDWTYSNIGIALLADTLEKVTHKNLNALFISNILQPLKMQAIGMAIPAKLNAYYARGYDEKNQPVPEDKSTFLGAAWAVKASVEDMQKFLSAAIGLPGTPERILYPMRLTQSGFISTEDKTQGLGWDLYTISPETINALLNPPDQMVRGPLPVEEIYKKPLYNGDMLIDKTGGTDGFRAYIAVIPNKKTGIVMLMNHPISNHDIVATAREILFKANGISAEAEEQG